MSLLLFSPLIGEGGIPPGTDGRITAAGDDRITADGNIRIVPGFAFKIRTSNKLRLFVENIMNRNKK